MASDDVLDREEVQGIAEGLVSTPYQVGGKEALLAHDAALRERVAELEETLEGLLAEVDGRSYKEGCKCHWCESIRRARRALDKGEDDGE